MPQGFRKQYTDQLPKLRRWSFLEFLGVGGAICSMLSVTVLLWKWEDIAIDLRALIVNLLLLFVVGVLVVYIVYQERKKLHRYAQTVYFVHFVNHAIRDYLAQLKLGNAPPLRSVLEEILTVISQCFSLVTGKQCRCSVKDLRRDQTIVTEARDLVSSKQYSETSHLVHTLDENSDFHSLWYGISGCSRYFLGRNLIQMWKEHNYRNSSFKLHGGPETKSIGGFTIVRRWPLPYRSAIVWPIRFVPDYRFWPPPSEGSSDRKADQTESEYPHFWGFLCVDCVSTGVFDAVHCPELGAAFADALYTLFTESRFISDHAQEPSSDPRQRET